MLFLIRWWKICSCNWRCKSDKNRGLPPSNEFSLNQGWHKGPVKLFSSPTVYFDSVWGMPIAKMAVAVHAFVEWRDGSSGNLFFYRLHICMSNGMGPQRERGISSSQVIQSASSNNRIQPSPIQHYLYVCVFFLFPVNFLDSLFSELKHLPFLFQNLQPSQFKFKLTYPLTTCLRETTLICLAHTRCLNSLSFPIRFPPRKYTITHISCTTRSSC